MQIVVISLTSATQRRRNTLSCFTDADIPFSFFDAILPEKALEQFSGVDLTQILLNTGRPMSPAEMACFASHRAVWQHCVKLAEPMIVLEDDVAPAVNWAAGLFALQRHLHVLGYVRLDPARRKREKLVGSYGGTRFIRLLRCPFGAHAYAITPSVAQQFLSQSEVMQGPIDVFVKQFWNHGTALYRQEPAMIYHRRDASETTIAGRDMSGRKIASRIRRQVYKLIWAWQRGWFNVRTRAVTKSGAAVLQPHLPIENDPPLFCGRTFPADVSDLDDRSSVR